MPVPHRTVHCVGDLVAEYRYSYFSVVVPPLLPLILVAVRRMVDWSLGDKGRAHSRCTAEYLRRRSDPEPQSGSGMRGANWACGGSIMVVAVSIFKLSR
jgi:hypothetical protein